MHSSDNTDPPKVKSRFREHHDRMELLHRREPRIRAYKAQGTRYSDANSAPRVFYCSSCKAPVVDSPAARRRHFTNSPKCKPADQVKPDRPTSL